MVRILGSTGSRRRRRYQLAALFSVVALLALIAVPNALAVLTDSPSKFESNDGNMIVNGGAGFHDWANVSFTHITDVASSQSDDSFVSGQKQDTVCPDTYLHGNPPKDDFTDIASYSETNTVTGDTYLYGATIRYTANGSASENIELKQGTAGFCPGSTTLLARVPGDKLIAIDYTTGGTTVTFSVLTWIANGACFVGNDTPPCWGANVLTLGAAGAEGLASQLAITAANNPISGANLVAGQFAEFGVNLRLAGIIPAGTCKAFPQTVWESRSSGSSFVSTTKDISIENKTISNCGEIKIIKRTTPRGVDQNFNFTSSLTDPTPPVTGDSSPYCQADTSPSAFTLNDKDGATGDSSNNTEDCLNVQPGNYTVTEDANPTGFAFDSLVCTATGTGSSGSQNGTTPKQADITVAAGGVVTCVYTNKQQLGAIKISKTSSKTGNALAGATFSITKGGSPIAGSPFTTDSNGNICVDGLGFGDYVVTETGAPTGFVIDDSSGHTVTVDNNAKCSDSTYVGESISFTDTPVADIQVRFRDGGSGETSATISCDNSTGTTDNSDTTGWNKSKLVTGIEVDPSPITVTCTIVIDP